MSEPVLTSLSRPQIAALVADSIPAGAVVNLGIGIPTLVGEFLEREREIILHSENGILGMGPAPETPDPDLINASRQPISLLDGASISDHSISFALMRGGHLDYSIMGGFQVSQTGDLANWITKADNAIPAVGGAMDLAVGAKNVIITMTHNTREGAPKLVASCDYPLTGTGVVSKVYTDLAIVAIEDNQFVVEAMVAGISREELQRRTGATLRFSPTLKIIHIDEDDQPYLAPET